MSEGVVLPLISPSRLRTSIEERLSQLALGGGPVGLHEISSAIDWYETQTGQTVPREMQRELLKHFAPATQAEGWRHHSRTNVSPRPAICRDLPNA
ncbi:hypothetical protein [Pseudosulfitobacter pseudonitzschiae]|uniref:hypothetical protein n=1 Tax=Pseudosulfitobacter pseudonitzschiae TaxID=1402135 RepID=UPI001E3D5CCB|nr:hypothetical protein [Pseudosulfitobacter pseudonitzschiae]MCI2214071.1 hypothetical protein [Pseudosulfitobacter pseudonitzschiae]UFE54012.1 hypothetical protein LOE27_20260 [Pseudosulfitobacter pseudonitzschiae]UFE68227.1 hypothetical protein LOE25_19010 [Pseudosulfitobacter pseudonitzschiae]UFE75672.1 hypothetical protein LOE31_00035 [Pseudosulfitobacter pseudonitzschiae]UFE90396.1 hypothetical protein LOE23_02305 [Pseudosulfitobacter pseudonitzschiae]